MPEGDTIHYAAHRIRPVLQGRVPDAIATPQRRHGLDRWPERLAGRRVTSVRAHGKHLFLHFEGGLALHSHLRMTGSWRVYGHTEARPRSLARVWLVIDAADRRVVQFGGPVLELLTDLRTRSDPRLASLGPDVLGPELDEGRVLRRLRADDPSRPVGDALLDQRTIAGIGNLWKAEACFAAAVDPWRPAGRVSDTEVLEIVRAARTAMGVSARGGWSTRPRSVYGRAGRPCPRCGAPIRCRGQGDENRCTYWCASCQR